jgi:hypothetical protein
MNTVTLQKRSPFKFLDSYNKNDKNIFFGRDEEIKALYELVQTSKLIMIYGASGTGKTSLVECGLSNKFSEADWFDVRIRRGNVTLLEATLKAINRKLDEAANDSFDLGQSVEALYYNNFIPIYLIFDQFEELFIMGDAQEREDFFNALSKLLHQKVPCKVILIVREEYLAFFHDYEILIPFIYDSRFRIERMNQLKLEQVIKGTIEAPQYFIDFDDPIENTRLIIDNLRNERQEVDLTNLQVYLDRLYKVDIRRSEQVDAVRPPFKFDENLIEMVGKLPQVIAVFLDEQMQDIDKTINYPNATLMVLKRFVTNEGTKCNRNVNSIVLEFGNNNMLPISTVEACIHVLYERRILKELMIGEELRYEISHDLLAGKIYERFSIGEKEIIRAERMVKDGFEFHKQLCTEGGGVSFLREEQIFFIQNLKAMLQISEAELQYFNDSTSHAEDERNKEKLSLEKELELQKQKTEQEEKAKILQLELFEKEKQEAIKNKAFEAQATHIRNQNRKFYTSLVFGVIMAGMLVAGLFALVELNKQKQKIEYVKNALEISKQKAEYDAADIRELYAKNKSNMLAINKKEFQFSLAQAETYKLINEYTAAISSLESAKRIDSTQSDEINRMIVEISREEKIFSQQLYLINNIDSLLRTGSDILNNEDAVNGKLLKPEMYNQAYNNFSKAFLIFGKMKKVNNSDMIRVMDKLKQATITSNRAFEGYIGKGNRFQKAKGLEEAIVNYEKALAIENIDSHKKEYLKRMIEECRNTIK